MNESTADASLIKHPITLIFLFWFGYLLILSILQLLGFELGFRVWALDEDKNWLAFLVDSHGKDMIRKFWVTDYRNPLSAWWWYVISPLIHFSDYSLYFIRKCVDPLLSISIFILLDRITFQRARVFCLYVAVITLLWNFSAIYSQIQWNFLAALALNLLVIFFYCGYV